MSGAAKKAGTLWLRKRVTLDDAPYLVQDKIGGGYDDARSLLIDAVADGDLPAQIRPSIDPYTAKTIGPVEASETTVATADVAIWLGALRRNDASIGLVATATSITSEVTTWQEIARQIANDLDQKDMASELHDSVKNMADRVARELRTQKVFGPRGPLSPGTVLREALQGGKWNSHRPNKGAGTLGNPGLPSQGKK